jgi:hypothetical protein
VATGKYEDLVKAGVVDPTKVTRTALQNAASISALMLTTDASVTEMPRERKTGFGRHGLLSHTIPRRFLRGSRGRWLTYRDNNTVAENYERTNG